MSQKLLRIKALIGLFFKGLHEEGPAMTMQKLTRFLKRRTRSRYARFIPDHEELVEQREQIDVGLISLLVPLYNTPERYLEQLCDSIVLQSYRFFEVCFADASDAEHRYVGEYINSLNDIRIRYMKVKNRGISANTNAAATLATGELYAFCDHDDILSEDAFYHIIKAYEKTDADYIYSDEALFENDYKMPTATHFKPDFSPHYLTSCNYICHLSAIKSELFKKLGGLRPEFDGSQDHDLILRAYDAGASFHHVKKILYYWRVHAGSTSGGTAAKPFVQKSCEAAVADSLDRRRIRADVEKGLFPSTCHVKYKVISGVKVSIIIPTCDHAYDLERCITSIYQKTDYKHFEIIIVENNSKQAATFELYNDLKQTYNNLIVVKYEGAFNFSKICNTGAMAATGEHILLLNNDVEVISPGWLGEMLGLSCQDEVGAVGAKLLYPDGRLQHGGVIVGLGGYAGHSHKYFAADKSGYMFRIGCVNNFSAVTGACLMVKRRLYRQLSGLDENFAVAYNDVDFCLRLLELGLYNVYTPYAQLYHHESLSRGLDTRGEKKIRFTAEQQLLYDRYGDSLKDDRFYNPGLTLDSEDFAENLMGL